MAAFANYLGISPPLLSHYMNGVRKPSIDTVHVLAEKLGNEIYDVLGFQRPDPALQKLIAKWEVLSDQEQREILGHLNKILGHREKNQDDKDR